MQTSDQSCRDRTSRGLRKPCWHGKQFALAGKKLPAQTVRQAQSPPHTCQLEKSAELLFCAVSRSDWAGSCLLLKALSRGPYLLAAKRGNATSGILDRRLPRLLPLTGLVSRSAVCARRNLAICHKFSNHKTCRTVSPRRLSSRQIGKNMSSPTLRTGSSLGSAPDADRLIDSDGLMGDLLNSVPNEKQESRS